MDHNWHLLLDQFLFFTLVLTRVGGLFMTMPVFGTQSVSPQVRALLAVGLSLLIVPSQWGQPLPNPGNLLGWGVMLGREAVVGLSMGLAANILFSGLQLAGQVISQISGLSLADVYNPMLDTNVPVFAQLLDATAMLVLVATGGHREIIAALLDTFHTLPPGELTLAPTLVDSLTLLVQNSFTTGIRAAAPVLISLLLSVLIVALVSRTVPQLNTMNLGFALNSLVLLGALAFSLGSAVWIFQEELRGTLATMEREFVLLEE
jgi:flagellar biosynthetic protein FliR